MNLEFWTEAAQFPEKEYINGIFVAVYESLCLSVCESLGPLCLNNRTETTTMPNGGNWPSTNHVTNMAEGGYNGFNRIGQATSHTLPICAHCRGGGGGPLVVGFPFCNCPTLDPFFFFLESK